MRQVNHNYFISSMLDANMILLALVLVDEHHLRKYKTEPSGVRQEFTNANISVPLSEPAVIIKPLYGNSCFILINIY